MFATTGLLSLTLRRVGLGLVTLLLASVLVFLATQALPGDAARAIAGRDAPAARLLALRQQLNLDEPLTHQYARWLASFLHGNFGTSLGSGISVASLLLPRIANSLSLLVIVAIVAVPASLAIGVLAAVRHGRPTDTTASIIALALSAVPEFIIGIGVILLLATLVFHWFPPVSLIRPGHPVLARPRILVLPVLTLCLAVFPYLFRMTRGLMIDVLESDYIEMAIIKGMPFSRVILVHALPNLIGPLAQVIALVCAYLAGGIVVVEYVFGFPGIGQGLVNAVATRDLPTVQTATVFLAGFYIFLNVFADIVALLANPRERRQVATA